MEFFLEFFHRLYHFEELIRWGGYTVLCIIVFAETGLLAGFFLPGDSLLVTAGLLAAVETGMNIWVLNILLSVAAVTGDSAGYWLGHHFGPRIFNREDSFFFHKNHLIRTQQFYKKYGPKTIVLARFVPIVRTFAPTVAGVGRMDYRRFLIYNVAGGSERANLETGHAVLARLGRPRELLTPGPDRPEHDRRYAMMDTKLRALGWQPATSFEQGLDQTIAWYREHADWWRPLVQQLREGTYHWLNRPARSGAGEPIRPAR